MFSNTRFNQLTQLFPRSRFNALVDQFETDKSCKRFLSWDQLIVMIYGQLAGAGSLRDLEAGF